MSAGAAWQDYDPDQGWQDYEEGKRAPKGTGEKFIAQNTPKSAYGFTPGNIASNVWEGAKGLASGLYGAGKEILAPEGNTEGERMSHIGKTLLFDPAEEQMRKAREESDKGNWVAGTGHNLAAFVPVVGPWAAGLGEQAGTGDVGGALARGGTQAGITAGAKPLLKGTRVAGGMLRDTLRENLPRTPEGELTPGTKVAAQLAGGGTGLAAGTALGHPYAGGIAGYRSGPAILDRLLPEPEGISAKRVEGETYQQKAEDLMRRGKEQSAFDREVARTEKANAPAPYKPFRPLGKDVGLQYTPGGGSEGSPASGARSVATGAAGRPRSVTAGAGEEGATGTPGRLVIRPGERVDPLRRESAGSAAQATDEALRQMAEKGDRSAELELIRRRKPLGGITDYSNVPRPRQ